MLPILYGLILILWPQVPTTRVGEQLNILYSYQDSASEVKLKVFEAVFNRGKELAYKTLKLKVTRQQF